MDDKALKKIVANVRGRARQRRRTLFLNSFVLTSDTTILDVGSEDGSHLASIIEGSGIRAENVTIADIEGDPLLRGRAQYGFNTCVLSEGERLPFESRSFDIVYSNSAIEHVTVPKEEVWRVRSGRAFRRAAWARQSEFASEVRRVGCQYFVQTPNRAFPIESHTWLPGFGWLPRPLLLRALKVTNRIWVKKTAPDWALLSRRELQELFPDAQIVGERLLSLTKSLIAIKSDDMTGLQ